MSDIKFKHAEKPRRRRSLWLQVLVGLALAGGACIALLYYALSSDFFLRSILIPKASKTLNSEIQVSDAQIKPFSEVTLTGVTLTPKGSEKLLTVNSVKVHYDLRTLLKGNLTFREIALVAPEINLVEKVDGTSNLDPILKALKKSQGKPKGSASESSVLNIQSLKISAGRFRSLKHLPNGVLVTSGLSDLNISANNIANRSSGQAEIAASISLSRSNRANMLLASINADLLGSFIFTLTPDLAPAALKGNATFAVDNASGDLASLQGFAARLDADTTTNEIKSFTMQFNREAEPLGEVRLSGPFDAANREGKVKLEVDKLRGQVLSLFAAKSGLDFGQTTINASSEIDLTKKGDVLAVIGDLNVDQLRASRDGQSTPKVDLHCDYSLAVDKSARSALLGMVNITGTQDNRPFIKTALTSPMTLAWGDTAEATADATLEINVTGLNLKEWQPLIGGLASAGLVAMEAKISSHQTGRVLDYQCKLTANNLVSHAAGRRLANLSATIEAEGESKDLREFKLNGFNGQILHYNRPTLSIQAVGEHNSAQEVTTAELTVLSSLADLCPALSMPEARLTSGAMDFRVRLLQKTNTQVFNGRLRLAGLMGTLGETTFLNYTTETDFEFARTERLLQLRKLNGRISEGNKLGGRFTGSGNYDRYTEAGDLKLKLTDFNQFALRPYLEAAFGNHRVSKVWMDGSFAANRTAEGEATVKANLQLTNLVTIDLKTGIPTPSLDVRTVFEAGMTEGVAQIQQGQLMLTPTSRSKNIATLTGKLDFSKPEAVSGHLKLVADSLDLTRYCDLFGAKPSTVSTRPDLPETGAVTEPEPTVLPYQSLICELNIGRLYAREIDAEKIEAATTFYGDRVVLKPLRMKLNGADVDGALDVDLSVPGYAYELAFDARAVPLGPLMNTLHADRKNQIAGQATLTANFKGAGMTATNLERNLTGELNLSSKNLNLALGNVRNPTLNLVVNTVVGLPELLGNPAAALDNLVGRYATFGPPKGSWASDLMYVPLEGLDLNIVAGNGKVKLEHAELRSASFKVKAIGNLHPDATIEQSAMELPLSLSLDRNLATKIGLIAKNSPDNAAFFATPEFVILQGTLNKPKTSVDQGVVWSMAAQAAGGVLKQVAAESGDRAKSIIQSGGGILNSLLGGKKEPVFSEDTESKAGTDGKPFDLFGGDKKR